MAKTNIDKLMELKQLYEQGILTKEEMEIEKKKILLGDVSKGKQQSSTAPKSELQAPSAYNTKESSNSESEKVSFFQKYKTYIFIGIGILIASSIYLFYSNVIKKDSPKPLTPAERIKQIEAELEDDIDVPQLKVEDPYIGCIKIKDLFEIIRKDDSSVLRTFLTKNGFKAKGKDEEYSSAVWSKIYGSGTEADTVSILMYKITDLVYLDLSCTKDAIMNKWISEIKELGYTFEAPAVEGGDTILSFNKSDGTSGLIQYMSSPKKNRLNVITNFAFIIENDDNSDDVRVKDDDYLFTFVGKIEGSATQYPFKMAINVYGEGNVSGYYIVTNGGNERVSLKGTIENWTDKFEGAITLYEYDKDKKDYTGFYFQGDLTIEHSRSGSFAGYSIDGRYKNGSDISWPFSAVSM